MIEIKTTKPSLTFNFDGKLIVSFETHKRLAEAFNNLPDKPLLVTVKEYKEKRSKNANDYCWELIGKLSKQTGEHKNDIYRKFIYELGIYREWKVDEASAETLMKVWQAMGIGWIVERVDSENGLVRVHGYYGSSSFNTKQMYKFIQNIVNECKTWGIETRTPDELANLASLHKAEKL